MKKRDFLKTSLAAASTVFLPKSIMALGITENKFRTAMHKENNSDYLI